MSDNKQAHIVLNEDISFHKTQFGGFKFPQIINKNVINHRERNPNTSAQLYLYMRWAYPVMRGRVSVEKRERGDLSRTISQTVYCPLCLGWKNTAMSRLQGPWPPHSQGLSTQGPPNAEPFTQRNSPVGERKSKQV